MCWCSIAGSPPLVERAPRLLFVPVSGPFGMGEYARSLAIARGAARRWAGASVHFVLSRAAPYADGAPFPATLLASSATFHSGAVIELIERWRPDVVIFDNAGRTAQLRAAKRCGARVVYVSARRRQRRKAFRSRWMRLIDEHWIAYPEFIAGPLSFLERLKLNVWRRPTVRYLDVMLDAVRSASESSLLSRLGREADRYVLVVPGGGTGHPGARNALELFLSAARALAASGTETIFVGEAGALVPSAAAVATAPARAEVAARAEVGVTAAVGVTAEVAAAATDAVATGAAANRVAATGAAATGVATTGAAPLLELARLPQADLIELMRGARLVVANGGSTLLQAIACARPCVAAPIAADQGERIRRCASAGVVVAVRLDADAIAGAAAVLLGDDARRDALSGRAIALGLTDGVEVALRALDALLGSNPGGA
jgi:glycosyltransferase involved in cell wall biosynthesis